MKNKDEDEKEVIGQNPFRPLNENYFKVGLKQLCFLVLPANITYSLIPKKRIDYHLGCYSPVLCRAYVS